MISQYNDMSVRRLLGDRDAVSILSQALHDEGNLDAANVLSACRLEHTTTDYGQVDEDLPLYVAVRLSMAAHTYSALESDEDIKRCIYEVIYGYLPFPISLSLHFQEQEPEERHESESQAVPETVEVVSGVDNQAVEGFTFTSWQNLRFRSLSEERIARALDRKAVAFWPNCKVRIGTESKRQNREADFLVLHQGKWGILEVDGPHHRGTAFEDHERDRLFKLQGVRVVEHFDASRCFEEPDAVATEFLSLLGLS